MQYVEVDYILPVANIGDLMSKVVTENAPKRLELTKETMELLKKEVVIATRDNAFEMGILEMGELTTFSCPECKGALVRIGEGEMVRYRCHTGHAFTTSTLLACVTVQIQRFSGAPLPTITRSLVISKCSSGGAM